MYHASRSLPSRGSMARMVATLWPGPMEMPAGFVSGAIGGTLAAVALLLVVRGIIHLRFRPTVLPPGEVRAMQFALFLLGLAGGGLGRTHGWALQFGLVLIGLLGSRYFTYGASCPIEVVGLSCREVDEAVSRVVSSIWLQDRDSRLLGPVPLIVVAPSTWEPRTVWLQVSPDDPHVLSLLRFGLALLASGTMTALLALAILGW